MLQDRLEFVGGDREIKKPIAAGGAVLVDLIKTLRQTFEAGFVAEIALMIKNCLAERLPDFIAHNLAREFPDGLFHFAPKFVVALFAAGKTDHSNSGWQLAVSSKIIKRRQEFAV